MAPQEPGARTGRLIALGLFWAVAAFVGVSLLGSVAWSLYGAPPKSEDDARQHAWCLSALTGLRDDLEGAVLRELAHPEKATMATERWTRFRQGWEPQLEDATARCAKGASSKMTKAFEQLRVLYTSYAEGLAQITTSRTELARDLSQTIQELKAPR